MASTVCWLDDAPTTQFLLLSAQMGHTSFYELATFVIYGLMPKEFELMTCRALTTNGHC